VSYARGHNQLGAVCTSPAELRGFFEKKTSSPGEPHPRKAVGWVAPPPRGVEAAKERRLGERQPRSGAPRQGARRVGWSTFVSAGAAQLQARRDRGPIHAPARREVFQGSCHSTLAGRDRRERQLYTQKNSSPRWWKYRAKEVAGGSRSSQIHQAAILEPAHGFSRVPS